MNVFRNTLALKPPQAPILTKAAAIEDLPPGKILYVRVGNQDDLDPDITVKSGDTVAAGATLCASSRLGCVAPKAGTVVGTINGADLRGGRQATYLQLEVSEEQPPAFEGLDPQSASVEQLTRRLTEAAIVTGAPQPVALASVLQPEAGKLATLIVLAGDQEPGVSATAALLDERKGDVGAAIALLGRIAGGPRVLLALPSGASAPASSNAESLSIPAVFPETLEALVALRAAGETPVAVVSLEAALSALDAVRDGAVPTARLITVLGPKNAAPRNLRVPLGTPIRKVIEHCGFEPVEKDKVVAGGPMRGFAQYSLDAAIEAAGRAGAQRSEPDCP